jgi:hypothetical protein
MTVSLTGAFVMRIGLPEYYLYADTAILTLALSLALKIPLFYFLGLYNHPKAYSTLYLVKQSAFATFIASAATLAILLGLTGLGVLEGGFPRSVPIADGALSFVLVVSSRWILSRFSHRAGLQPVSPLETLKTKWRAWLREGTLTTASWAARWVCTCCGTNSHSAQVRRSADRSSAGGARSAAGCTAARRAPRSPSLASILKATSTPGRRSPPWPGTGTAASKWRFSRSITTLRYLILLSLLLTDDGFAAVVSTASAPRGRSASWP